MTSFVTFINMKSASAISQSLILSVSRYIHRNGVAPRTYFASRMIIDFLRQMPGLPSVFIGLPKLARMESRAAAGVLVVRAESVERRRTSSLNRPRVLPRAIRVHHPFLETFVQSTMIGKWYREFRELHSILNDFPALPLCRVTPDRIEVKREETEGTEGSSASGGDDYDTMITGMARRCIRVEAEGQYHCMAEECQYPASATFNCVSISSRESSRREDFSIGVAVGGADS